MNIKKIYILFFLAVIILLINGCKTVTRLTHRNFDYLYDEARFSLNPDYRMFHHLKDSSTLFFRISSDELQYTRDSDEELYKANYKIRYKLFTSFRDNVVLDSLTTFFSDIAMHETGSHIIDSVVLSLPSGDNYLMQVEMTDLNDQSQHISLIRVNKTGDGNLQYFKVYRHDVDNGRVLMFSPFLSKNRNYILQYRSLDLKKAEVEVYSKPQPVALPPFANRQQAISKLKPDSVYQIDFEKGIANLSVESTRIYRIKIDEASNFGALLYCFYEGFPAIEGDQRLYPLRYLTTGEEFETILSYPDPVDAVDIFWNAIAGTHHRGNITVDRYYDNVQQSNIYFTTWKEGWKTDRGMIYSVFGPPNHVTIDLNYERWIYDGSWQIPQTEFRFRKMDAPLGTKCYELERKPEYRNVWFHIVENLRR